MSSREISVTGKDAAQPGSLIQGYAWLVGGFVIIGAAIAAQAGLLSLFGRKN